MNALERKMVELLTRMHEQFGVVLVKGEFESEGTRKDEFLRLKEMASRAGQNLVIKIGGGEAISDMRDAQLIGVWGIVAPMVETAYALQKYVAAVNNVFSEDEQQDVHFGMNIETETAQKNFGEILDTRESEKLHWVTVGRVDMCGSLGLGRDDINCDRVFEIARGIMKKAKARHLETTLGGGIAVESLSFAQRLTEENLLDRFETRKVVFPAPPAISKKDMDQRVLRANEFELMWLKNKSHYYSTIAGEDRARIAMLEKRVQAASS